MEHHQSELEKLHILCERFVSDSWPGVGPFSSPHPVPWVSYDDLGSAWGSHPLNMSTGQCSHYVSKCWKR